MTSRANVAAFFAMCFLVLAPGTAYCQGAAERPSAAKAAETPITMDEMADVMQRIETAVMRTVFRNYRSVAKAKGGSEPATTGKMIAAFGKLFDRCKPKFKLTPKMTAYDASVLTIKPGEPERSTLEKLVKWGFVGPVGPLATSETKTLTPVQFGDALGLYLSRLAELTHTPSSEWSPYLNWHRDGE